MTNKRLFAQDPGWIPDGWWYPYSDQMRRGFQAILESVHGHGRRARTAWAKRGVIGRYVRDLLARR